LSAVITGLAWITSSGGEHRAREPEVGHPDPAVAADQHVVGLEVAMEQPTPCADHSPRAAWRNTSMISRQLRG